MFTEVSGGRGVGGGDKLRSQNKNTIRFIIIPGHKETEREEGGSRLTFSQLWWWRCWRWGADWSEM